MPDGDRKYILAIDLGTSGPKVALVTTGGAVVASAFEPTELVLLPGGGAEQRPDDWWAAVTKASRRLLDDRLVPVDDVVAVGCTGQWSGTVAVDGVGDALGNAIIWMDSRGSPYVREITGGSVRLSGYGAGRLATWVHLTGGVPARSGKDPIAHILWLRHERPDVYRATDKFLEPKDYLNLRLTGRAAASYDSITLHWVTDNRRIDRIAYSDRLLRLSTLAPEKLPHLRRAVDVLGPVTEGAAAELGLPPTAQVVTGTPDVQSAAVGSGAIGDFEAHLYIGTSSWLTCHVPFKKTDLFHNVASLPSALPGRYFVANEQETAGACLTWLRDNVLFHEDELETGEPGPEVYEAFDAIAARVPAGSGGVVFTPWLNGERTPVDDHNLRAAFFNQSLHTTREHLVRAVLEGVAYNSRWLLGCVERFVKRRLDPISLIGGGARSDVWCQIHADVLGRTIRRVADPIDANARGAALLAAAGLGYIDMNAAGHHVAIERTFDPDPARGIVYGELFGQFLALYKSTRRISARLQGR